MALYSHVILVWFNFGIFICGKSERPPAPDSWLPLPLCHLSLGTRPGQNASLSCTHCKNPRDHEMSLLSRSVYLALADVAQWSIIPYTRRGQVRFSVRTYTKLWVQFWLGRVREATHRCFFSSLCSSLYLLLFPSPPSLPLCFLFLSKKESVYLKQCLVQCMWWVDPCGPWTSPIKTDLWSFQVLFLVS